MFLSPDTRYRIYEMSDMNFAQNNSSEKMVEFENLLNGEVTSIKTEDIKAWELKRELCRLELVASRLSAPSHLARIAEAPEEWGMFACKIIGQTYQLSDHFPLLDDTSA